MFGLGLGKGRGGSGYSKVYFCHQTINVKMRCDVSEERCSEVESLVFDLFANLGATEEQLDFPVLYASVKEGWASLEYTKSPAEEAKNMLDLLHINSQTCYSTSSES
ncbi:uncharacterized protein LOC110711227 isoform X2 [Chenopodium quinoa]|uniref:uncharacterized protein LOC110711227 isoform X2 n=1 Tax=Chenopodium quinoa TaxID=63459 RepID=UPI000B77359D|nr:uncharacterized protein LOC110711227 isoform X2 [Chenopodium quinoa]